MDVFVFVFKRKIIYCYAKASEKNFVPMNEKGKFCLEMLGKNH